MNAAPTVLIINEQDDIKNLEYSNGKQGKAWRRAGVLDIGSRLDASPATECAKMIKAGDLPDDRRNTIHAPQVSMPRADYDAMLRCPQAGRVFRAWLAADEIRIVE